MSDLSELFARDVLNSRLNDEELNLVIRRMRDARGQFNLGNKAAGNPKKLKEAMPKITNLDEILGDLI